MLPDTAARGLLGGEPVVSGGSPRVTGAVTSTRCDWLAPNGRYLRVIALDGPGLPSRAETVRAGATAVPGRSGIVYHPDRGLIVMVSDRLYQVVAGGAGTAQARVTGLKAIDAIRAAASS